MYSKVLKASQPVPFKCACVIAIYSLKQIAVFSAISMLYTVFLTIFSDKDLKKKTFFCQQGIEDPFS